jgi:hypothetical protein
MSRTLTPTEDAFSAWADQPITPFDFGDSGFTACCNIGGEILEITAPSNLCGYVSVKGAVEDSADSLLSRVQRPVEEKATFSLKVTTRKQSGDDPQKKDGRITLGPAHESGCLNHRWPFTKHWLQKDNAERPGYWGDCTTFSFVKDETVYQVMRLELFDSATDEAGFITRNAAGESGSVKGNITIKLGGHVRFSCRCCSLARDQPTASWNDTTKCAEVRAKSLPKWVFLMKLTVDNVEQSWTIPPRQDPSKYKGWEKKAAEWDAWYANVYSEPTFDLISGRPVIVKAAFKLQRERERMAPAILNKLASGACEDDCIINNGELGKIAGITHDSQWASAFMWKDCFKDLITQTDDDPNPTLYHGPELGVVARCLERLLSSHYIPPSKEGWSNVRGITVWPHVPATVNNWRHILYVSASLLNGALPLLMP